MISPAHAAQLVAAEYFIGSDPGAGGGTALVLADTSSLATGFEQASLSLSGQAPGTYSIGLRVKDDQGRWSNPAIRRFTLSAGDFQLAGGIDRNGSASQGMNDSSMSGIGAFAGGANAEYFIGSDPGAGSGTALVLADTSSLATGFTQASLSLYGQAPGTYSVGIRVRDDQGRWSNPAIRRFTLSAGDFQLAGGIDRNGSAAQGMDDSSVSGIGAFAGGANAEYFIGSDPGAGSGTALVLADTSSLATGFEQASLSLSGQAPGTYSIGLRVKDDQGRWSNPAIRRFTLSAGDFQLAGGIDRNGSASQGMNDSSMSGIGAFAGGANAEYFIGSDPGAGSGTALVLADTSSLATGFEQASLSLSGQTPGTYTVGIRVRDDQGRWSNPAIRRFTITDGNYRLAGGLDPNGSASQGMNDSSMSGIGAFAGGANAEYFIGSDPGAGGGTALVLADTSSLATGFEQASLSLSGKPPGTYSIGLRVKDDQGRWSNPAIRRFTLSAGDYQLAGGIDRNGSASQGMNDSSMSGIGAFAGGANAEYFIGSDPGAGGGTALVLADTSSLATGFEQASLSLSGKSPGTYSVGLRVKDDQGRWSNPAIRRFTMKDNALIAQTETEIAQGDLQEGSQPRPQVWSISPRKYYAGALYQIAIGGKTLEIQRRPEETLRSFMLRLQQAITGDASLTGIVTAEMAGTTTLLITNKSDGASPENWVSVSAGLASKIEQAGDLGSEGRKIVAAEYFTDLDPGEGGGYPVTLDAAANVHRREFSPMAVDIAAIKSGSHRIGVRFKNAAGHWGSPVFRGYGSFQLFGTPDIVPPVITLLGSANSGHPFGQPFVDPGFVAMDDVDGAVSESVVVTGSINPFIPGAQTLSYRVVDRSGNQTVVTRQVNVLDASDPVFTGDSLITLNAPPATTDIYRGLGAEDAELGSLSHRIRLVSGSVDWSKAGSYALVFEVSDTAGNTSRFTRTVTLSANATQYPTFESWISGRASGLAFSQEDLALGADPDQDGLPNRMEWLADTDPFDAFSKLEMDFTRVANGLLFQWSCNQRINYWIDSTNDLKTWSKYCQEVNTDTGEYFALDVPIPAQGPNSFFRLSCSPRLAMPGTP